MQGFCACIAAKGSFSARGTTTWHFRACQSWTASSTAGSLSRHRQAWSLTTCTALCACFACIYYALCFAALQITSWGVKYNEWSSLVLNATTLLLAVPLHGIFCKYLWDQRPQAVLLLVALSPAALLSLVLTQSEGIRYLAGSALVMALLQFFSMRHQRRVGMKAI